MSYASRVRVVSSVCQALNYKVILLYLMVHFAGISNETKIPHNQMFYLILEIYGIFFAL